MANPSTAPSPLHNTNELKHLTRGYAPAWVRSWGDQRMTTLTKGVFPSGFSSLIEGPGLVSPVPAPSARSACERHKLYYTAYLSRRVAHFMPLFGKTGGNHGINWLLECELVELRQAAARMGVNGWAPPRTVGVWLLLRRNGSSSASLEGAQALLDGFATLASAERSPSGGSALVAAERVRFSVACGADDVAAVLNAYEWARLGASAPISAALVVGTVVGGVRAGALYSLDKCLDRGEVLWPIGKRVAPRKYASVASLLRAMLVDARAGAAEANHLLGAAEASRVEFPVDACVDLPFPENNLSNGSSNGSSNMNGSWIGHLRRAAQDFQSLHKEREAVFRAECPALGRWSDEGLLLSTRAVRITPFAQVNEMKRLATQRYGGHAPHHCDEDRSAVDAEVLLQQHFHEDAFPGLLLTRQPTNAVDAHQRSIDQFVALSSPWVWKLDAVHDNLQMHLACLRAKAFDLRPQLSLYAPSEGVYEPGNILVGDGHVARHTLELLPLTLGLAQVYAVQPCSEESLIPTAPFLLNTSHGATPFQLAWAELKAFAGLCCKAPASADLRTRRAMETVTVYRNPTPPLLSPCERAVGGDGLDAARVVWGLDGEEQATVMVRRLQRGQPLADERALWARHAEAGRWLEAIGLTADRACDRCRAERKQRCNEGYPPPKQPRVGDHCATIVRDSTIHPGVSRFARALAALCGHEAPIGDALDLAARRLEDFVAHGATTPEVLRLRDIESLTRGV